MCKITRPPGHMTQGLNYLVQDKRPNSTRGPNYLIPIPDSILNREQEQDNSAPGSDVVVQVIVVVDMLTSK